MQSKLLAALPLALCLPLAAAGREARAPAYHRPGKYEVKTKEFPDLVDRKRKRRVPVKVLYPAGKGRFPLVVMSHGGAGSWDAHLYDARHLASHGYVVLCPEHVRSNTATVKKLLAASGAPFTRAKLMAALQRITTDPEAVLGRPRDVSFAIDQAALWNRKDADLRGKIDVRRIAVAGHSYGAYTALVVCGARPILDHLKPRVGKGKGLHTGRLSDRRVTFGFAMSPQGPGTTFFGPQSFKSLRRPVFCLSGSKDGQKSKDGTVMPAARRLEGFKRMPRGRARMLWLKNADHFSFAYNPKSWIFPSPARADTERIAKTMLLLNCNWYLKRDRAAKKLLTPKFAESLTGKVVTEITWLESAADAEALQKKLAAEARVAVLRPLELGARVKALFAKHEGEALKNGWRKKTLTVGGLERKLMWKAPKGTWRRGVIIALHGGGGSYSNYASNIPLGRPMVEFSELALKAGFALISPDSTNGGAADGKGRSYGKRWDCVAADGRGNVDLPFIRKIIDEVIPELRPAGSGGGVFLTGISNGGFMTVLAATSFPGKITAFAPVACGDPYGTHMDMGTHPRLERSHAPGVFRDNTTRKLISEAGAAEAGKYTGEKPWPRHKIRALPRFKQFQDRNDGIVDYSLAIKARKMLVRHGYQDAGGFILKGGGRSFWKHFWQSAYNRPLVEFFVAEAEKVPAAKKNSRAGGLPAETR